MLYCLQKDLSPHIAWDASTDSRKQDRMLNTRSLQKIQALRFSQQFIRPHYEGYCFSNLPSTIKFLLTGTGASTLPPDVFADLPTRYDKVILLFIDAFGWRFFERYLGKHSMLKTILTQGVVSKMTSQFPSTTAAHATCIHTGLTVGQSGIYEWNYYEPLVDDIIAPLLFSYGGDKTQRDTLKQAAIPAEQFYPQQTFYQNLHTHGVTSYILQYQAYTPSTYSDLVFRGARVIPYKSIQEALSFLAELVAVKTSTPSYYFLYFDRIDYICHHYGPLSRQVDEIIENFLNMLEQLFYKNLLGRTSNTLCLLTADHGQVEVYPSTVYYLNHQLPQISRYLKTNRIGHLLVPAGSPRDMFLYVKEELLEEGISYLQQHLTGKAEVYCTQELLARFFFGLQAPSPTFLARLGNVVILPYKYETVWWYEENKFDMHFLGHHGGLTREEMEIPLLVLPLF
jgi:predicted AlkP superfamily pyrophosphatase or phosphodiesterase